MLSRLKHSLAITLLLIISSPFAYAQFSDGGIESGSLWYVNGTVVELVDSSWSVLVPALSISGSAVNSLGYFNNAGNFVSTSSQPLYVGTLNATSTSATSTFSGGLVLARSAGNVGIGTTTPISILDVVGTTPYITIQDPDTTVSAGQILGGLQFRQNDISGNAGATSSAIEAIVETGDSVSGLRFFTKNSATYAERFRISGPGRIGIGSTTPADILSVRGSDPVLSIANTDQTLSGEQALFSILGYTEDIDGAHMATVRMRGIAIDNLLGTGGMNGAGGEGTGIAFDTGTFSAGPTFTLSEKMRLDHNGNLGIGTTTPWNKLTLEGGNFFHRASTTPRVVKSLQDATNLNGLQDVQVVGNLAYVVGSSGDTFAIIDVSSSTNPVLLVSTSSAQYFDGALSLAVAGSYAYIGGDVDDMVTVVDVSNPANPIVTGTVTSAASLDNPADIAVSGRYAYVTARSDDMMTVLDISDPFNPRVTGSVSSGSLMDLVWGIGVQGKYVYTLSGYKSALTVIDVSQPETPIIVGSLIDTTSLNGALSLAVSGRYLYTVASTTDMFTIIDISNPLSPTLAGSIASTSFSGSAAGTNRSTGIAVAGNYAYVGSEPNDQITVVDISNPSRPYILGVVTSNSNFNGPTGAVASGRYVYFVTIGDQFTVVEGNGIDTPALYAGALGSDTLDVQTNASVGGRLNVAGSINVGIGGIYSNGGLYASVATTSGRAISGLFMGGNVALGTTTPNWDVQIANVNPSIVLTDTNASGNAQHWFLNNGNTASSLTIGTTTNTFSATTTHLTVSNAGNLGIATTGPAATLSVVGRASTTPFFIATSTPTSASTTLFMIDPAGDVHLGGGTPVVSACGTGGTLDGNSTDQAGTVTLGTGATGCTITFSVPKLTSPHCVVSTRAQSLVNAYTYTVTAQSLVIAQAASDGTVWDYICMLGH